MLMLPADPHRPLRSGQQDPKHPHLLGSRSAPETSRCDWFTWE
jgi:hypothetical protein